MKKISILSVCGSGTVTSSMIAGKLKDILKEKGYGVSTRESRPTEALQLAQSGQYDLITYTSPLPEGDYGIPVINAIGLLTGFSEDEVIEEVVQAIETLEEEK